MKGVNMPLSREQSQDLTRVGDVDWGTWSPVDFATLLFVIKDDKALLIHKKRGLGIGKINAPGGKLEIDTY